MNCDYTELIKALRNCGDTEIDGCVDCKYQEPQMTCNQHLMKQAADAIEELVGKVEQLDEPVKLGE